MKVYLSKAIRIKGKEWSIACDSTNSKYYPLVFYSHAHSDHIPRKLPSTDIISSSATRSLLKNFTSNFTDGEFFEDYKIGETTFKQKSAGHIIGSTALKIESDEGNLIYTGDVSIRDKGFIEPFKPEKCDTLIIDTTFGSSEYEFPEYKTIIKETQDSIVENLNNNTPVVLMGYALGKAQMLYHAFSHLSDTVILHGANHRINSLLKSEGIEGTVDGISYQDAKEKGIIENQRNWILFAPLKSGRNEFYSYLRNKVGAVLYAFSGWCISSNYKYRMDVDYSIPISDHADFSELLEICELCKPDKIFTIYGSNVKFAAELRKRGFNAIPLSKQTLLESYF
ncbi:MAG: hypothetical protein KGD64_02130 [Candidatus Heimdallarchaeota archaeon]|nr:hypothetical protein [Candidatus Heimdallarchaeota archaeon]